MSSHLRSLAPLAAAGAILLLLTGCASSESAPAASESTAASEIQVAWLDDGRAIGVVTYGSSTCEPAVVATDLNDGALTVELADPEDTPCTADYVPRATVVSTPEGVDPAQELVVVVEGDYAGEVALAGDAGLTGVPGEPTDYAPTAGWTGEDTFLILTWGSSNCPPVVESAEVDGEQAVAVVFETPPADQVCTMDMAPRVSIVTLTGAAALGADVTAYLTGGEFDGVAVTIAGTR